MRLSSVIHTHKLPLDKTEHDRELIGAVVEKFKEYSSFQLDAIIFSQTPWKVACRSNPAIISCESIRPFF